MKYKLTDQTINHFGRTLYRIQALKDFGNVYRGDLGGYIEKEENLSQAGLCWVSDSAMVYENAEVYGNAKVSGYAEVYGGATVYGNAKVFRHMICTSKVFTCTLTQHNITVSDNHISIGCEVHTFDHWLENVEDIGRANQYLKEDIELYSKVINSIIKRK